MEELLQAQRAVTGIYSVKSAQKAMEGNSGLLWCSAGLTLATLWTWFSSWCSSFWRWWSYCSTREPKMIKKTQTDFFHRAAIFESPVW